MDFKDYLRNEISYQGITIKELADKSGIPKRTIDSYVDSRGRIPTVEKAVSIAKALNVSVEYLVTGKSEETKTDLEAESLKETVKEMLSIPQEQLEPIKKIIHNTYLVNKKLL